METVSTDFIESTSEAFASESYQSDSYLQAVHSPDGDDEDVNDEEEEKDSDSGSDGGDPPLNEEVVHSPVPPATGGKPK